VDQRTCQHLVRGDVPGTGAGPGEGPDGIPGGLHGGPGGVLEDLFHNEVEDAGDLEEPAAGPSEQLNYPQRRGGGGDCRKKILGFCTGQGPNESPPAGGETKLRTNAHIFLTVRVQPPGP